MSGPGFYSILFLEPEPHRLFDTVALPAYFFDLNLDQIEAAVVAGYELYQLEPFFRTLPQSRETIAYRHAVFRDLEKDAVATVVRTFAQHMDAMRAGLAEAAKRHYPMQKQWGFLGGVSRYCAAIAELGKALHAVPIESPGLQRFRDYLRRYSSSPAFVALAAEATQVIGNLGHVTYRLTLRGNRMEVTRAVVDEDYSEEVEHCFEKFRQHAVRDDEFELPDHPDMDHIEAAVLDMVALLHPTVFLQLAEFCERQRDYLDVVISDFHREIHFYLAYLAHIQSLTSGRWPFCYPEVRADTKDIECREAFDLALAHRMADAPASLVVNDVVLKDPERVMVVSGANQGGKTTFARLLGQLHYLGRLGCPVPAQSARLFFFDQLFTHFEREEDLRTLRSKLEDDLTRIHDILQAASAQSLLIMNESFSSATLHDALLLSREIMQRIVALDLVCVFVTFLDELASFGPTTVSMTSMVDAQDITRRTFKIVRRPADGLAYAMALAEKYGLTYEGVKQRVGA
jgi:hypothetical protein